MRAYTGAASKSMVKEWQEMKVEAGWDTWLFLPIIMGENFWLEI